MISKKSLINFITKNNINRQRFVMLTTESAKVDVEYKDALPFEAIPGPSKTKLLLGFLPNGKFYKKSREDFTNMLRAEYGDLFKLPILNRKQKLVILYEPAYFEKIYRTEGIWPQRLALETMKYYRQVKNPETYAVGSLITEKGEPWGKFRSIVNPVMMQPKTIRIYVPKMEKVTSQFINRIRKIRDPETLEVPGTFQKEINQWALESVAVVALDTHLGLIGDVDEHSDGTRLIEAVEEIFTSHVDNGVNPPYWRYYETKAFKKLMKAYDDMTSISKKYIAEAIERYKSEEIDKSDSEQSITDKSVVERLINVNKDVAVVLALEMFFAGVDTTTTAISGCLLALSKNPEKQAKLRAELLKILPAKDTCITEEKLKAIPYLKAVIKESIRVHPVANENARGAGQDIVLNGYQIPKDTDIVMMNASLYKDEKYFPQAKQFLPERWLRNPQNSNENQSESAGSGSECPFSGGSGKPSNPFVYLPFGFGTRMCIGKRIVEMEMEIALAKIIRNFQVEFNYSADDVFTMGQIFTPAKELKFKFIDIIN